MPTVDVQKSAGLPGAPEDSNRATLKVDSSDGQLKYHDGTVTRTASQGIFAKELVLSRTDSPVAGAAGTYTASVTLPAGSSLIDILVNNIALWNAGTSANLEVGDTDPDGIYTAVDLKATDLLAGESLSFALAGGVQGAYIANSHLSPRYSATARTISAIITTVGTCTTGATRVTVIYAVSQSTDITTSTYAA